MNFGTGSLRYAGSLGYDWSSSSSILSLDAFDLDFGSVNVYLSTHDGRWYGFAVRSYFGGFWCYQTGCFEYFVERNVG